MPKTETTEARLDRLEQALNLIYKALQQLAENDDTLFQLIGRRTQEPQQK